MVAVAAAIIAALFLAGFFFAFDEMLSRASGFWPIRDMLFGTKRKTKYRDGNL